jgi:glycosyltransferase
MTGWMPPHTSVVASRKTYEKFGLYDARFGTAADYEWLVRVMMSVGKDASHFPEVTLSMRVGGMSNASWIGRLKANAHDARVWVQHSRLLASFIRIAKPARKIGQFLVSRKPI